MSLETRLQLHNENLTDTKKSPSFPITLNSGSSSSIQIKNKKKLKFPHIQQRILKKNVAKVVNIARDLKRSIK